MKALRIILSLAVIAGVFYLLGCGKPVPLGGDYEIHVLADSTIWKSAESILRTTFERTEYNPQPEKWYTLVKQDPHNYKRYKNLLFLSTLDSQDELSQAINNSLSPQALEKVKQGEFMFASTDAYAQNQKVLYLIAPDLQTLKQKLAENSNEIFEQFESYWQDFHKKILYSMKEQKDVEKHLLQTYGWMVRLPVDYRMVVQSARDRFVMFHRKLPLRWISVFWEEATDPSVITKEYCVEKRNQWAKSFYEKEHVDEKFQPVVTEEVNFLERRALLLKGLWSNDEKVAGGPFWMYCFFDEKTERIYFIDMHIFAPDLKRSKMHYLRQMNIIAHTFKTNLEIKPEDL
ncbi:MAG: DUF4837 family protein [Calditrichaeota bacterium]|nr:DUF4837 family protein [Calditrichota bacterium]